MTAKEEPKSAFLEGGESTWTGQMMSESLTSRNKNEGSNALWLAADTQHCSLKYKHDAQRLLLIARAAVANTNKKAHMVNICVKAFKQAAKSVQKDEWLQCASSVIFESAHPTKVSSLMTRFDTDQKTQ